MSLTTLHPVVRDWFEARFGSATEPQQRAWPAIRSGEHVRCVLAARGGGAAIARRRGDQRGARSTSGVIGRGPTGARVARQARCVVSRRCCEGHASADERRRRRAVGARRRGISYGRRLRESPRADRSQAPSCDGQAPRPPRAIRAGTLGPVVRLRSSRDLLVTFRRMEARGEIRGGRFVSGFVGEQFARPEAVELLREIRRDQNVGAAPHVAAADPLNLGGIITPGPRVSPHSGLSVPLWDVDDTMDGEKGSGGVFSEEAGENPSRPLF